jgi:hypothetical protein
MPKSSIGAKDTNAFAATRLRASDFGGFISHAATKVFVGHTVFIAET